MRDKLRRLGIAAAVIAAVVGTTVALPNAANARWGGGWHGGHGGGWGGFGVSLGTGVLLGARPRLPTTAAITDTTYAYGYGPSYAAYGGGPYYGSGCSIRGRWVRDGYGHRVWRRVRVCY